MGLARKVYEKLKVGEADAIQAGGLGVTLETFQIVVAEFEDLQGEGLINILDAPRETQSGHGFVDLVRFERIT